MPAEPFQEVDYIISHGGYSISWGPLNSYGIWSKMALQLQVVSLKNVLMDGLVQLHY